MKMYTPEDVRKYFNERVKPEKETGTFTEEQLEKFFSWLSESNPPAIETGMVLQNPRGEPPITVKASIQFDGEHIRIEFKDTVRYRIGEVLLAKIG